MRLDELAKACAATLEGDPAHEITDVGRVEAAASHQVCFVTDRAFLPKLAKASPGAVITWKDFPTPAGMNRLVAADPDVAFSKAVALLRPESPRPPAGVHPAAVVAADAQVGEGTTVCAQAFVGAGAKLGRNVIIHPQVYIGAGVSIGDDSVILPNVTVMDGCTIGRRCLLHPGARIGADGFGYHFVAGAFMKAPQRGTVVIEDDVEIGANTTIDRARFDVTRIGAGTKIDNLCQIGHNVQIGRHCVIAGLAGIAGSSVLQDYVMLGGNAGVSDHVTIGMGAKLAAKSGLMRDAPPGANLAGLVADDGKLWMRREAAVRRLPEALTRLRELEALVRKLAEQQGDNQAQA